MPKEILWLQATLSAVALLAAAYFGWRWRKKSPWVLAGLAWYGISLAPVSGVTQAGNTFFGDRFAYLPQIGLFLAVALSGAAFLAKKPRGTSIGIAILGVLVLTYGAISFWYARFWKNTAVLFTHATAVTENNFIAHTTAALALVKNNDYAGALHHFEEGLRINPRAANFRNSYGDNLVALEKYPEAAAQFEQVLAIEPLNPTARYKLATTQIRLGRAKEALSNFQELKARQVKAPNLDEWIERAEKEVSRRPAPEAQ